MEFFNGLGMNMGNLSRLSNAKTRSISPENFTGEKGRGGMAKEEGAAWEAARELGQGWKVSPYVKIKPNETFEMANIDGPGAIQHMWLTIWGIRRFAIIRIYWEDSGIPSVECPVNDFFAAGWEGSFAQVSSIPVSVNPSLGHNCYWEMPFRKKCRITMENIGNDEITLYYQITYALTEVGDDCAYFHAQFRRQNPVKYKEPYTIVDGIEGKGHYVGTSMLWGLNNCKWWGEGEIKFYMDDDREFPTICGTGTEDYFGGAYNFDAKFAGEEKGRYMTFTAPYAGMYQVIKPDGLYNSQTRFGMYRWHILDPIRFEKNLKVTIQDLGWRFDMRYLARQDDLSSVAYWYQDKPAVNWPKLPDRDYLEII